MGVVGGRRARKASINVYRVVRRRLECPSGPTYVALQRALGAVVVAPCRRIFRPFVGKRYGAMGAVLRQVAPVFGRVLLVSPAR